VAYFDVQRPPPLGLVDSLEGVVLPGGPVLRRAEPV
jgi:hypothetical protein